MALITLLIESLSEGRTVNRDAISDKRNVRRYLRLVAFLITERIVVKDVDHVPGQNVHHPQVEEDLGQFFAGHDEGNAHSVVFWDSRAIWIFKQNEYF